MLQAFFESALVATLVSGLLDLQDSLVSRSADISRIVYEKVEFGVDDKADKKSRKK